MSYRVSNLETISDLYYHPWAREDTIQTWLNAQEEEGYTLVGILQGKPPYDEESNEASGAYVNGTMLIVHKDD